MLDKEIRFSLGRVFCTPGALKNISSEEMAEALKRHQSGDWGCLCKEDIEENEIALEQGFRLLSVYYPEKRKNFWIITEADRSVTTVLLPEEY